jgi:hypothetical protein
MFRKNARGAPSRFRSAEEWGVSVVASGVVIGKNRVVRPREMAAL